MSDSGWLGALQELQQQIGGLEKRKEAMQGDLVKLQAACNEQLQLNSHLGQRLQVCIRELFV